MPQVRPLWMLSPIFGYHTKKEVGKLNAGVGMRIALEDMMQDRSEGIIFFYLSVGIIFFYLSVGILIFFLDSSVHLTLHCSNQIIQCFQSHWTRSKEGQN